MRGIPPPPSARKKTFALPVNQVVCGDNLTVVSDWPDNCIDGIVTDPPYGLGFMGKEWDTLIEKTRDSVGGFLRNGKSGSNPYAAARYRHGSDSIQMQEYYYQWAKAMLRICKPGAILLCFGGTRTFHRLTCAIEDAGWEIRDCMMWLYGSGFPKSHDISKAIDKAAGVKRKILKERRKGLHIGGSSYQYSQMKNETGNCPVTAPATDLAKLWSGYGTALKPAWEPIIVAMKPLDGTFAANAEKWKVAGLNIDGGRIGSNPGYKYNADKNGTTFHGQQGERIKQIADKKGQQFIESTQGRWPANLILDEEAGKMLDEQSGVSKSKSFTGPMADITGGNYKTYKGPTKKQTTRGHNDSGGASRFFYCAKTSRKERNLGLGNISGKKVNDGRQTPIDNPYQRGETVRQNTHPTVKPLALMRYLCTLLKMPNQDQIILDPFMGSGTTGMACKELGINYIGIEKEKEYCEIAEKRIAAI